MDLVSQGFKLGSIGNLKQQAKSEKRLINKGILETNLQADKERRLQQGRLRILGSGRGQSTLFSATGQAGVRSTTLG